MFMQPLHIKQNCTEMGDLGHYEAIVCFFITGMITTFISNSHATITKYTRETFI